MRLDKTFTSKDSCLAAYFRGAASLFNLSGGSYQPNDMISRSTMDALRQDVDTIGQDFRMVMSKFKF